MLLLVRHAMPAFNPEVPPERWQLGPDGQRGAETLRHVIPRDALLVSSGEPKARQTLEPTGQVFTDIRFGEVARDEPFHGDYRGRRRAYINGTDHPGWEPRRQVAQRFDTGVRFWCPRADPRPLVVATHGMALTLWLTTFVCRTSSRSTWPPERSGASCRRCCSRSGRTAVAGPPADPAGTYLPAGRDTLTGRPGSHRRQCGAP